MSDMDEWIDSKSRFSVASIAVDVQVSFTKDAPTESFSEAAKFLRLMAESWERYADQCKSEDKDA